MTIVCRSDRFHTAPMSVMGAGFVRFTIRGYEASHALRIVLRLDFDLRPW
jgi:hypothetical protein